MPRFRIIPRLDIKNGLLVKGVKLEGLKTLGNAKLFAQHYASLGVDELLFIDAVASLYDRNTLHHFIKDLTKSVFIPVTVGGGIKNIHDVSNLLENGADKICINTYALKNPNLINELTQKFGSSTITLSLQIKKMFNGRYALFSCNGRERSDRDLFEWIKEIQDRGAGELLITVIDKDGTGMGYDLDIIEKITNSVSIPVIASGGAKTEDDILRASLITDALAIGSAFHYEAISKIKTNKEKLKQNFDFEIIENINSNKFSENICLNTIREKIRMQKG